MTPGSWVIDSLLQSSLKMRNTFRRTPESHLFTKVVPPFSTNPTPSTRNAYFKGDSITKLEASDLRPDGNDDTRRLMTKRERRTGTKIAIGKLLIVAHI